MIRQGPCAVRRLLQVHAKKSPDLSGECRVGRVLFRQRQVHTLTIQPGGSDLHLFRKCLRESRRLTSMSNFMEFSP